MSVGPSVRPSVGPSHFAFFAFLGYLEVGKHIFKYVMSHKQHLQSFCIDQSVIWSISWSVGLSVGQSNFAFLGYLEVGMHLLKYLMSHKQLYIRFASINQSFGQ